MSSFNNFSQILKNSLDKIENVTKIRSKIDVQHNAVVLLVAYHPNISFLFIIELSFFFTTSLRWRHYLLLNRTQKYNFSPTG
jgi:hypothetical protein